MYLFYIGVSFLVRYLEELQYQGGKKEWYYGKISAHVKAIASKLGRGS